MNKKLNKTELESGCDVLYGDEIWSPLSHQDHMRSDVLEFPEFSRSLLIHSGYFSQQKKPNTAWPIGVNLINTWTKESNDEAWI